MRTQKLIYLARRIEPVAVILLLLYYVYPQMPGALDNPLKYLSYGVVGILFLSAGMGNWQRLAYVATRDLFPLVLLGLSIISVLWSAAPNYTIDEVDPVIRACLFSIYIAMRYTVKEQMRLFAWMLGVAAVLSLIYALAVPSEGIAMTNGEVSWKGIFQHKQYLGRFMVLGAITFINIALDNRKYQKIAWIGVFLTATLALLSSSRSALILLLFSILSLPLYRLIKQKKYKLRTILLIVITFMISASIILVASNLETIVVDILGKNLEFNGRIPVWTLAIQKGLERPLLGYGYVGFWTSDESLSILNSTWALSASGGEGRFHAHNGFIDVFLQLGFVGLLLCLLSFITLMSRVIILIGSHKNGREFFWIFQFLLITFLANLSEIRTFIGHGTLWILYVSLSLSTAVLLGRTRAYKYLQQEIV
ncbi:MAG: O-antigen ligase family protein [Verrucomicrobiota bacterium]